MLKIGDDVEVEFKGHRTAGEVVSVFKSSGFVLCRIHTDPTWDYGDIGEDLDPEPFVCVREDRVKALNPNYCQRCGAPHTDKCKRPKST